MAKQRYARYTYVDEELLKVSRDPKRVEFVASNCEKLADFLEGIPESNHCQRAWFADTHLGDCRTVGCALGWAVMSGIFPGLQYAQPDPLTIVPIVNAKARSFDFDIGEDFFGLAVYERVFLRTRLDKEETVHALRKLAKDHRIYGRA